MKKVIFVGLALIGAACMTAQAQDTTKVKSSNSARRGGNMTKVESADLPSGIQNTLKGTDYSGWTVSSASTNTDKSRYQVNVSKGTENKTLWFDANGNAIQRKRPQ